MGIKDWFKDMVMAPEDDEEEEFEREEVKEEKPQATSRIRPFQMRESAENTQKSPANIKVVLAKPITYEDGRAIADHLNAKRTVIVNLEDTPKDIRRRLLDFLSGAAYANNGQLQRVANSTYIITPRTVDVMGDMILGELESSGLFDNI